MNLSKGIYFITGIGTDVGKSIATGWLARTIAASGNSVITEKMIQTGNHEMSEDIETHRRIMGCGILEEDIAHTTAPVILSYPASPDLAAKIDGVEIDLELPYSCARTLAERYDYVLVEGAGGIMVPLHEAYLTLDWLKDHPIPAIVVVNGALGSINHSLLTTEALIANSIEIAAIIYNPYFDRDATICADTKDYLQKYIMRRTPNTLFIEMPANVTDN